MSDSRYRPALSARDKGAAALLALASALLIGAPLTRSWEGLRLAPYRDAVGVATVCYGETRVPMHSYSRAECDALFRRRFRDDYMLPIAQCVPTLAERPRIWGASGALAYNIGVPAFCHSTAAAHFRARRWTAGCDSFLRWNRAGGRVLPGLANRRWAERAVCLGGAAR